MSTTNFRRLVLALVIAVTGLGILAVLNRAVTGHAPENINRVARQQVNQGTGLLPSSSPTSAVSSVNPAVHSDTGNNSKSLIVAQATPEIEQNQSLKTSVQNADFIFQGVVTKIEYRLSDKEPQLPHTFVTFKVEKFLTRELNQQFITLRFIGGPDTNRDKFLTVPGVPLFDVGDKDVLLVKGNGKLGCPLVECEAGRFRIIKNQVVAEDGRPILLNNQGELAYGKPLPLEEVLTNKIGQVVIKDVLVEGENQAGSQDLVSGERVVQSQEKLVSLPSLTPSQLELLIKDRVMQLTTIGEARARQFVISVDSQEKFSIAPPKPLSPPQIAAPRVESLRTSSEADRKEMEMLEQNGGNPVFPNSKP